MYIPSNEKIQVDQEATYGEGAAATVQLAGVTCRITPKPDAEQVIDKRGDSMAAHQAIVTRRWSEIAIDGLLAYEQAHLWYDSLFGLDATDPKAYLADLDHSVALASLCLYYGQTGLIYKVPGILPYSLNIKGESGKPVTFAYRAFGQAAVDGASFAALSDPSLTFCMGHHATVYLDPIAGPIGTTALTDLAFSWDALITGNYKPVWHLGDLVPDSHRPGKWGGSFLLKVEADASRLGYLGDILDNTINPEGYAVRVKLNDGTNELTLDFAGQVLVAPELIPEKDGVTTVEFPMVPVYSSDATFLSSWGGSINLP